MGLALKKDTKYTYQDYILWPEGERWEIIEGIAYNMSPAPSTRHQMITAKMYARFESLLKDTRRKCTIFISPTDVVLSVHDVVQPDVFIICDKNKITEKNILGAPDLIVEVLSPNTALKDKREKKALYEYYGVKEYLIVDPVSFYVERYFLGDDAKYGLPDIFGNEENLHLKSFEGIEIPLSEVFEIEI